jgi:hypothetical protein
MISAMASSTPTTVQITLYGMLWPPDMQKAAQSSADKAATLQD